MANSIAAALNKTVTGQDLIIKTITTQQNIKRRIRELKSVAFTMIVENDGRKDVYDRAKPNIKKLAVQGGTEYEKALKALKMMYIDNDPKEQFKARKQALAPLLK